jgi:hypothetical protein
MNPDCSTALARGNNRAQPGAIQADAPAAA